MTCTEADLKQEDVKDVKINPKYLQCDQYPSCDRWFRHGRNNQENPANKKESYLGIESPFRDTRTYTESMNFVGYNPNRAYYPTTWSAPSFPSSYQEKGIQRINQSLEKERGNQIDARSYHPASMIPRIDRPNDLGDKSMESTLVSSCDSSIKLYQQDFCLSKGPLDVHGRVDSLELRLRGDYSRVQTNYSSGKFVAEDEALERNLTTSENCLDGDRIREDRAGVIRSRESSFQSRTTSLQYTGRTRSYEKQDYGEDLTCGESCCRWRTPRRHVANRVTASPWRQIVRPHHSPKLQPIILQTHTDETEVGENVHVPETTRPAASSNSPNRQSPKNVSSTENFYGFEVPTACEMNPNSNTKSVECSSNTETRLQEFYPPPMAFLTQPKIPSTTGNVKCNETLFQSQNNLSTGTRLLPSNTDNVQVMSTNKKSSYFGQSIPQTSQKPELSHPISRLCDTIESDEKSDNFNTLEVKKLEEESRIDEKIVGRIFVNSDSNNNDAIVSTDATPRGRSIGGPEDHRCDQCGKTFVTRASLKVHSRTHSGEKPFRCADCGKQFSQLRNYKYHRSVHEGTREFAATCPECGKYFNDRGYLSSHMKIHRNRKEYGCAECGKSFNQRVAYNMHARIHTGVKPHQCEQCGKAFSRKMLLKQHLRTHSGERPYQCQVCQKAFADRSNMTLHTRLHSGLKPYQCTLCSKAFTKKHHLKTHLNYHTGTKPYSCPNCGLRFSQSSNMRTHFKKCAVNNPGGVKNSQNEGTLIESSKAGETQVIPRTPTDALTPPNSDQESSILTPIPKSTGTEGSMT